MTSFTTTREPARGGPRWSPPRGRARAVRFVGDDVAGYVNALRADTDVRVRLRHGVDLIPALVHGCDHASITIVTGGGLEVRAATDRASRRADELQDELDEGPTLQAVRTGHCVVARDLSTETRWPDWCAAAVTEVAVAAMVSVLLVTGLHAVATLNLYSDTDDGLSGVEIALLHTLAGPLSEALQEERGRHHLGAA